MRILIGTPIHQSKDYGMEKWLENVSHLDYPTDFLLVDNSPGPAYIKKVKAYCKRYHLHPKIIHLELPLTQGKYERVARSREIIRSEFLAQDYDAWFTWECDQLIPTNALGTLTKIMEEGNYMMVNPNKWVRENPADTNTDFGCCLIKRGALEKYGFLDPPDRNWEVSEAWFKARVVAGKDSYADIYGVIDPIYHLDK